MGISMFQPKLIVLQPTPYCNIACDYCYLANRNDKRVMSLEVVAAVARHVLAALPRDAEATLVWHAGEPLAVPIAWYEQAYSILGAAAPPRLQYAIQTNGIAIDKRWIAFFRRTSTSVGVSIDGPARFHDARRKTRAGGPTWSLAMRGLRELQAAGLSPNVITVLSPDSLAAADEYFAFYRDNDITHVSFSIDETEGAHRRSAFAEADFKSPMAEFLARLLERACDEGFPLHIREIETIAGVLAGLKTHHNEQVSPWDIVTVGVTGDLSTFSPESLGIRDERYDNFIFGNILAGGIDEAAASNAFRRAAADIDSGVEMCRRSCPYFAICGGGAPVNKLSETGSFAATETLFCRLSIQASVDALCTFIGNRVNSCQSSAHALANEGALQWT
jgi:uncharacterized protein